MGEPALLLVDDDEDALNSLRRALLCADLNVAVHTAATPARAITLAADLQPHVAVIDLSLNEQEGVESGFGLLEKLRQNDSTCRIIVLTGHGGLEHGIRALSSGAANFLEKPAEIPHLVALIRDGIAQCALRRRYEELSIESSGFAGAILGESKKMLAVFDLLRHAARTSQAVVISGETGTGKGVLAFTIHRLSARSKGNFIRYQPHFGSAELAHSALFGHVKGAFTGAHEARKGLVGEAQGGTLFLDEVDELPHETQVSLLGVLQERKYRPLGSNKEVEADFRLIAASNQDLERCVESGKLRRDLFHRLAHSRIHVPALRERLEDIPLLARHFLKQLRLKEKLSPLDLSCEALQHLMRHAWPGNVRELEATVEDAAYRAQFAGRQRIDQEDLRVVVGNKKQSGDASFHEQVESFKQRIVEEALARCGNNQLKASQTLGIDRSTLRRIVSRCRSL